MLLVSNVGLGPLVEREPTLMGEDTATAEVTKALYFGAGQDRHSCTFLVFPSFKTRLNFVLQDVLYPVTKADIDTAVELTEDRCMAIDTESAGD